MVFFSFVVMMHVEKKMDVEIVPLAVMSIIHLEISNFLMIFAL